MTTDPRASFAPGDDDARVRALGLRLIVRLQALLRGARIYAESNQALVHQMEEALATIGEAGGDELTLVAMGDTFFVNGVRVRPVGPQYALFHALQEEFDSRGLGAIRFLPGLRGEELAAFLRLMTAARTRDAGERLPEAVAEAGVLRILPVRARDMRTEEEAAPPDPDAARDERSRAGATFRRALQGTRSVLTRSAQTGRPRLRQARHVIQPIVDSIMRNEFSIVGLTALKEHDEYTYAHSVNVSILSLGIGQSLGLSRATLANLGVAALLHDLGKIAVPPGVLHKSGRLTDEEWASIRRHPVEGVKLVTRLPGLTRLTLDVMRVALQHHMSVHGGGYPSLPRPHAPAALSRIVAVADCFDAMTAHRAYRTRPFTGREALAQLLGHDRALYDPVALWGLIRTVGLYPPGTVMVTASGHRVLSTSPNPADPARPFCLVLERPDGTAPAGDATWDPMPAGETVARILAPEEHQLPVERLLAA